MNRGNDPLDVKSISIGNIKYDFQYVAQMLHRFVIEFGVPKKSTKQHIIQFNTVLNNN